MDNIGISYAFIDVIKAYIHKENIPDYGNWEQLLVFAKRHSLENLFFVAVDKVNEVDAQTLNNMRVYFYQNIAQQMSQEYEASRVFDEFKKRGIKYMPLKGYYLRNFYPVKETRTSCDIDVFYDVNRKQEVDEILTSLGFELKNVTANDAHWEKGIVTFEAHFALAEEKYSIAYYENVWDRLKTEDGVLFSFTPEDFYIYQIIHAAKHFNDSGFGIRTVLDIYFYNKGNFLDKDYLDAEFAKLGLTKFVCVLEKLSLAWFDGEQCEDDVNLVGNYILNNGVYGNSVHGKMLSQINKKKKSKFSYLMSMIFLPYKYMKEKYPFLRKVPILLPFMWVYRWFEVAFTKRERIKQVGDTAKAMTSENFDKMDTILSIVDIPRD